MGDELCLACGMFGIRVNVEVTRVLVLVRVRVRVSEGYFCHRACCRGASYVVVCAYRLNAVRADCSYAVSPQWALGDGKAFDPTWCTSPA